MPDGCSHYESRCEIWAPCCHQYYRCFRCHDENDSSCGNPLDRSNVTKIRCCDCGMEQEPARECGGCHIPFAEYVCLECSMYRQSHADGIYHCPDCKVCRIGKGLDISHWHCHSCCLCLCLKTVKKEDHKKVCKIDARTSDCVVCFEPLHDSRDPLVVGHSCGHYLHQSCWEAYNNTTGKIACPICQEPFLEIDEWKLELATIVDCAFYWGFAFVSMVVMSPHDKLQVEFLPAITALAAVGHHRDGLVHLAAPSVVMLAFWTKQTPRMGVGSMAMLLLLLSVMDQIFRRLFVFDLPGRMRSMVLFFEFIASIFLVDYIDHGQYDMPVPADPKST